MEKLALQAGEVGPVTNGRLANYGTTSRLSCLRVPSALPGTTEPQ